MVKITNTEVKQLWILILNTVTYWLYEVAQRGFLSIHSFNEENSNTTSECYQGINELTNILNP